MATITDQGFPNLATMATRVGPDGQVRPIIEVLNKKLDFIDDIPWVECNLETGHQISLRTGLPTAQWRSINQGVSLTKSDVAQYIETTGMIEDRAEVDVDMPGDMAGLRLSEEAAKVEMMSQEFARAVFYESTFDNADRIHGLTPRYGAATGYTASNYMFTSATHAGTTNRSIWLIDWSPDSVFGIYPKRSVAGLKRQDLGEIDCFEGTTTSKKFRGYATRLQWKCGIAVADYRKSCRYQWDPDSSECATTGKGLILAMTKMQNTVWLLSPNARFYMDRTSFQLFTDQLMNNTYNLLEYIAMGGRRVPTFMGIPIRITDALVAETGV